MPSIKNNTEWSYRIDWLIQFNNISDNNIRSYQFDWPLNFSYFSNQLIVSDLWNNRDPINTIRSCSADFCSWSFLDIISAEKSSINIFINRILDLHSQPLLLLYRISMTIFSPLFLQDTLLLSNVKTHEHSNFFE